MDQLQKVQRRAARFVCNSYYHKASVTDMLNKLAWESLEVRRRRARLVMFYKIQNGLICIPLPSFIVRSSRPKEELPHLFKTVYSSTEAYRSSFFERTVREWNLQPVLCLLVPWVAFHRSRMVYPLSTLLRLFKFLLAFILLTCTIVSLFFSLFTD